MRSNGTRKVLIDAVINAAASLHDIGFIGQSIPFCVLSQDQLRGRSVRADYVDRINCGGTRNLRRAARFADDVAAYEHLIKAT